MKYSYSVLQQYKLIKRKNVLYATFTYITNNNFNKFDLNDIINQLPKPYIIVGGDFNTHRVSSVFFLIVLIWCSEKKRYQK